MKYVSLILVGWLFISSACTKNETPPPPATEEAKMLNISYGTDTRNKMDVYLPKNRTAATPFLALNPFRMDKNPFRIAFPVATFRNFGPCIPTTLSLKVPGRTT